MADDESNETDPSEEEEESSEDEAPEQDEEASSEEDEDAEEDDDDDLLEGDDELDADEKALLDEELDADEQAMLDGELDDPDLDDDDDDEDLEVDDEELDDSAAPVTEREQRRAGWGCLVMLIVLPVTVWYGAKLLARNVMELDQSTVPDWYLEAARNDALPPQRDASVRPEPTVTWLTEIDAALEKAQDEEKPLVVTFVTDEEESDRMTNGTWLNREIVDLLGDVVPLRLDLGDETTTLAERFEVTRAPTTLFLTPDLERLRPDTARLVDATDMEIYLHETIENHHEGRIYRESAPDDEEAPDEAPDEPPGE